MRDKLLDNAELVRSVAQEHLHTEVAYDEAGVRWLNEYIEHQRDAASTSTKERLPSTLGAFLGECIRHSFGGDWVEDPEHGWAMQISPAICVYPFNKVRKQLANAQGDSVLGLFTSLPALLTRTRADVSPQSVTTKHGESAVVETAMEPMDFNAWRALGRSFDFRGHSIFYQHTGLQEGTALLCIHGFPTASWDWHALWPSLTQRFQRVLAPDLLGFGWSAKPRDHAYCVVEQAELCEALLREQGITRVHVLAHDLGDSVAQELLARDVMRRQLADAGLRIESLVLLNGGLFPETHRPRLVQRLLLTPLGPWLARRLDAGRFSRSFAAVFGANTQPTAQELDEFWRLIAHADGNAIMHRLIRYIPERRAQRSRWVSALQDTPVPLRLIVGMDDPVSGAHMAERFRVLVPRGEVVPLPGIGHYPQVEAPLQVLHAIQEFHDHVSATKAS